jgi:hypothetical protein
MTESSCFNCKRKSNCNAIFNLGNIVNNEYMFGASARLRITEVMAKAFSNNCKLYEEANYED